MAFNSPILGPDGVGMLGNDGKLTEAAREAFVSQVIFLLAQGNEHGEKPLISQALSIPFPPVPGPKLLDPDKLLLDPTNPMGDLFWFAPSPLAVIMTPNLIDPEKDYQKIIVTNLYEPLVKMMNVPGNLAIIPIFDPTAFFNINVDIEVFLAALMVVLPTPALYAAFCAKYDIGINLLTDFAASLPKLLAPPPIPPSLPLPPIPDFDFIIFPDLFLGILGIPIQLMTPEFALSLITVPVPDPPSLFLKIGEIVLDLVLKILEKVGLLAILPKLLVATIIVILQNMISMMVCDLIGSVLGTGQVVKTAGRLLVLS